MQFVGSKLEATDGYLAPPLDGIWASAPYLHNGSVPTLEQLLEPRLRPKCFQRYNDSLRYDFKRVGWQYQTPAVCKGVTVFDTSLYGKGNGGHDYGSELSANARRALLEYLKTL